MVSRIFAIVFTLALILALPAQAEDAKAVYGVAMHGQPKYGEDFAHFDYVNPDAPKGGTLRMSQLHTFDNLNPFIIKGTPVAGVNFLGQSLLYDSLMDQSLDEPFSMYGLIAESIEMAPDNSSVAFNLRKDARWHDGKPITSEDVVWTFNTLLEHGMPFFKAYYGDVVEVKAPTPQRVEFVFKHKDNAELPLILSQMSILPKHFWTANDRDFTRTTLEPSLGSGPYKIAEIQPGRRIVYERVQDWWGEDLPLNRGRFNFDKIVYDYYRDDNVALEAFFAGEFDVREERTAKTWATSYDVPPVKDGRITKALIHNESPQGMQGFIYNIRRPVFQDIAVRKALDYAFDFEWSNKQFAYDSYTRTDSYFENSDLASHAGVPEGRVKEILESYKDQLPPEVFTTRYTPPVTDGLGNNRGNLRQAIKILNDAGYKLGEDGIRVHEKTGVRLEFEILDNSPVFERWVLPMIQNLERIGVKAHFRHVDTSQYQNRLTDFDFDMTIMSMRQSSSPGNEQRDYWASAKADMPGSRNYIGIKNPVIDDLIERIIQAPNREELVALTRALDRVLLAGHYVIPQWHMPAWRVAYWNKFGRPDIVPHYTVGITETWWVK